MKKRLSKKLEKMKTKGSKFLDGKNVSKAEVAAQEDQSKEEVH